MALATAPEVDEYNRELIEATTRERKQRATQLLDLGLAQHMALAEGGHACLLKPTPEVSASLFPLTAGAPGVLLPAEGGNGKPPVTGETRGDRT
jgi:hypothetical protein